MQLHSKQFTVFFERYFLVYPLIENQAMVETRTATISSKAHTVAIFFDFANFLWQPVSPVRRRLVARQALRFHLLRQVKKHPRVG